MIRYVWCEDSGSGYEFWKTIFDVIHPECIVETKTNNARLRKAVGSIEDDGNQYYIIMDTVADNPDVIRENVALRKAATGKNNVRIVKIHSFEFVLLSFDFLEQWVFAEIDELKDSRRNLLEEKDLLVKLITEGGSLEELSRLRTIQENSGKFNTEQLAAKLLRDITCNTGFETDKSKLGPCFLIDCCDWRERKDDDICGLDNAPITAETKKLQIVEHSVLQTALEEVGL